MTRTHWRPCPPPPDEACLLRWSDGTVEVGWLTGEDYLAPDGQDLGPVDPPAHWCEVPAFDWPPPDPPTARRPRKKPPPRAPRAMRVGGRLLAVGRGHEHLTLGDAWPFGHSLGLGDLCLRVVSIEWRAPGHDGITFLCGRPAGHTGECQG